MLNERITKLTINQMKLLLSSSEEELNSLGSSSGVGNLTFTFIGESFSLSVSCSVRPNKNKRGLIKAGAKARQLSGTKISWEV